MIQSTCLTTTKLQRSLHNDRQITSSISAHCNGWYSYSKKQLQWNNAKQARYTQLTQTNIMTKTMWEYTASECGLLLIKILNTGLLCLTSLSVMPIAAVTKRMASIRAEAQLSNTDWALSNFRTVVCSTSLHEFAHI